MVLQAEHGPHPLVPLTVCCFDFYDTSKLCVPWPVCQEVTCFAVANELTSSHKLSMLTCQHAYHSARASACLPACLLTLRVHSCWVIRCLTCASRLVAAWTCPVSRLWGLAHWQHWRACMPWASSTEISSQQTLSSARQTQPQAEVGGSNMWVGALQASVCPEQMLVCVGSVVQ
jgi:hypothetical protein